MFSGGVIGGYVVGSYQVPDDAKMTDQIHFKAILWFNEKATDFEKNCFLSHSVNKTDEYMKKNRFQIRFLMKRPACSLVFDKLQIGGAF